MPSQRMELPMDLPHDLKNFRAEDYDDPFQIISRYSAGYALLVGVILAIILAPVLK